MDEQHSFLTKQRPDDHPLHSWIEARPTDSRGRRCDADAVTGTYVKRRQPAEPGSIPDRLQMFTREVRFYTEVAAEVGVRVPRLVRAEVTDGATVLELEDLSPWREGADPVAAVTTLAALHRRWVGRAAEAWPWLPRPDVSDLVEAYVATRWRSIRERGDVTASVRRLGDSMVGGVAALGAAAHRAGPPTLTHGDASARNMRTGPTGEVALLDWEDVGSGPGIGDVAWFLLSSVDAAEWDEALRAYGDTTGFSSVLPVAFVQGLLSLDDLDEGSGEAGAWAGNLDAAATLLA